MTQNTPRGVLPIMAYMGRLGGSSQKGYFFQASSIIIKGKGFHKLRYIKGKGNWLFTIYLKGPLITMFRIDATYGCISFIF